MRLSTRLMLAMVGLVVLTAAAVGALIHRNIEQRALPRVLDRLDTRARLLTLQLEAAVAGARSDVSVQGQAIEGLVRASSAGGVDPVTGLPTDVLKKRIASRFAAELNAKPEYARFRIIGVADGGRELVRVDRLGPGGAIRTVPESELRRAGDRDYFKAAIRLPAKQLYASPIDLDRESGAAGKPQVPTLRVAAPIVAASGRPFGIFEPFFSTKDVGKGTGLGLSMVYGFVKQSGGHIKAYSEEGHGTTIRMYLPQAGAEPMQDAPAEPSTMESGSETILVVEDDAMVRSSVITQLQSLGYRTIAAGSGDEALALVDGGAAFDLLFTDVILSKPAPKSCSRPATPRTPSSITGGSIPACCCSPSRIGRRSSRA